MLKIETGNAHYKEKSFKEGKNTMEKSSTSKEVKPKCAKNLEIFAKLKSEVRSELAKMKTIGSVLQK